MFSYIFGFNIFVEARQNSITHQQINLRKAKNGAIILPTGMHQASEA